MDELKYLTNKNNVLQLTSVLQKISKKIKVEKLKNIKDVNIKEIDFLKEQLSSENVQLCLLSYQTFVRLVEEGTFDAGSVLSTFISMIPAANAAQYTAICEGVVSLLLLDLKRRIATNERNQKYVCPFGIKTTQHPLIILFQKQNVNLIDLVNKINGICGHDDKDISHNSIQFLRPLFLYSLCHTSLVPDSKSLWTCLLQYNTQLPNAHLLTLEVIYWVKMSSPTSCGYINFFLTEALEQSLNLKNFQNSIMFLTYLTALQVDLINWGYDPRSHLNLILKSLNEVKGVAAPYYSLLLTLLSHILHIIPPTYLADLTRLLSYIIIKSEGGNIIAQNMILEGLIAWIANPAFIKTDALVDAQKLIKFISTKIKTALSINCKAESIPADFMKYFHPNISQSYRLAVLSDVLHIAIVADDTTTLQQFSENITKSSHLEFSTTNNLFLRGLFLCDQLPSNVSTAILKQLIKVLQVNKNISIDMILPLLYKLSKENDAYIQLELLRALTQFACVKENIPFILNTLKSIADASMKTLTLNLYLRLWKCESRTYPNLLSFLSEACNFEEKNDWNITKAITIKEICVLQPSQHIKDLVVHLSAILNESSTLSGDSATAIALDAIVLLCQSHMVNIVTTWNALREKFHNENRYKSVISLCGFFGAIPLLQSDTTDYEKLYAEAIEKLWHFIVNSEDAEVIRAALEALGNFDFSEMTLRQIPELFRQNLVIPSEYRQSEDNADSELPLLPYVPGECWLQLIQNINPIACKYGALLTSQFISKEISMYRGGVYVLPEGRAEPKNLSHLHRRSPLRSIIAFLIEQSMVLASGEQHSEQQMIIIEMCLKAISVKFSKDIPQLNWTFLSEFLYHRYAWTKYCLKILAHQHRQSPTALNVLNDYMGSFSIENCIDPNEIEDIVEIMPLLSDEISFVHTLLADILKSTNKNASLFNRILTALEPMLTQNHLVINNYNENNINAVVRVIQSHFELINANDLTFNYYTKLCCSLPFSALEEIVLPSKWQNVSSEKLLKALKIRCNYAVTTKSNASSLTQLNPILEYSIKHNSDQSCIIHHLWTVLTEFDDRNHNNYASKWTMDAMTQIQAVLTDNSVNQEHINILINVFTLCIIACSGCEMYCLNLSTIANSGQIKFDLFPDALYALSVNTSWNENIIRIYEFLYHIYSNPNLPASFYGAIKMAFICCKGQPYFIKNNMWMKFVDLCT